MTKLGPRKSVDPTFWEGRLKAARDYHCASLDALTLAEPGQSCGPALSHAILAAIAYADAVTARKGQVVNQQDHRLAPRLLRDVLGNTLPDAQEKRYRRLLARKDEAQYGIRHIAFDEAQRAVEDLEAFAEWAEVLLEGSGRNLWSRSTYVLRSLQAREEGALPALMQYLGRHYAHYINTKGCRSTTDNKNNDLQIRP